MSYHTGVILQTKSFFFSHTWWNSIIIVNTDVYVWVSITQHAYQAVVHHHVMELDPLLACVNCNVLLIYYYLICAVATFPFLWGSLRLAPVIIVAYILYVHVYVPKYIVVIVILYRYRCSGYISVVYVHVLLSV